MICVAVLAVGGVPHVDDVGLHVKPETPVDWIRAYVRDVNLAYEPEAPVAVLPLRGGRERSVQFASDRYRGHRVLAANRHAADNVSSWLLEDSAVSAVETDGTALPVLY